MKSILVAWDFFGVINAVEPSQLRTLLQQLLDHGAEQIIVSHSSRSDIERYLEVNELQQFFVMIYGAEWHQTEAGMGKTPALRGYIKTAGPFAKQVMIGDSLNDLADARNSGMQAVLFDPDKFYANAAEEADAVLSSLTDLLPIVAGETYV